LIGYVAIVGLALATIASGIAKIAKAVKEAVLIARLRAICLNTLKCS
jgi:hypothetical protein